MTDKSTVSVGVIKQVMLDPEMIPTAEKLREMNEALLLGSLRQHEMAEQSRALNAQLLLEITGRELAEVALRESEQRYRTLFDLAPVGVYSCTASGAIQDFNRHAVKLWGRMPLLDNDEARFCGSFRMLCPDGSVMPHAECPMADVLSGKQEEVKDVEVVIERPDATRLTCIVNIRSIKNEKGEITGAVNCFYDITERRQSEANAERLAAIVKSSNDAIISTDINGAITSWNESAKALFQYNAVEVIGQSVSILLTKPATDEEQASLESIRNGQHIEHSEQIRCRKDGSEVWVSLSVSPLRNAVGTVIGASKIMRDLTTQKRSEEHRNVLVAELNHRAKNSLAMVQ